MRAREQSLFCKFLSNIGLGGSRKAHVCHECNEDRFHLLAESRTYDTILVEGRPLRGKI